jgi:coenzyme F420-0:L-glutamate ligase/coenzyme F420-1:gamma-L-glutamate ligase
VAQKIISKCENRYVELKNIQPSKEATDLAKTLNRDPAFIQIIQNESKKIISTDKNVIIVEHKLGFININAGIDRSNILQNDDVVLLLPENPSKSAKDLQSAISANFQRDIALIVTDSMTRPFRSGVSNFALASANIPSLIDLKGDSDIYGNILQSTEIRYSRRISCSSRSFDGSRK